ncbi:unnamed protein product [Calicophoron daubneyi]|uniref:C2H2-type domain-containing protein n=1 Tax=Calicophoron daubneyi TaxID=300641 RepID=A0AAV2TM70_CALDB
MAQGLGMNPFRRRQFRTLSLLCDDEPLSETQLKAYQTRLQEYKTFLEAVGRLALCGNVCVTEEAVTIGEHGLLTGESLNALQHAGAISVYNTLQQNNWEFPVSEEGEVAVIRAHNPVPDEFLDSEKPIRSDWPAIHISECFVEGERAKLHGSVRPLRTFLPPTVVFRNAADIDEDVPEPELNIPSVPGIDGSVELELSAKGITVKVRQEGKDVEYVPIEEYYYGRQEGNKDYYEDKGDFRFKCAVCQRIFYSNVNLMSHILGHVDEASQASLNVADSNQCSVCQLQFSSAFDLRAHVEQTHTTTSGDPNVIATSTGTEQYMAQTASQLLLQQRLVDSSGQPVTEADSTALMATDESAAMLGCRICGAQESSEIALARHLQSCHRQREMPYVCRLCLFRSSLYEDILDHFKKVHDNSNHLLCTYCLRIFTPSDARTSLLPALTVGMNAQALGVGVGQTQVFLQHLRMHQVRHQLRRCPTCKLNFTNKSDYQVHRRLDHKATRGVNEEEKHEAHAESGVSMTSNDSNITTEEQQTGRPTHLMKVVHPNNVTLMNAPEAGRIKNLALLRFPENLSDMHCLECGEKLGTEEHRRYLPCSVCRFATCCSAGYNRHIQNIHIYTNEAHNIEPYTCMPMIRPVYFQWIEDEVMIKENQPMEMDPSETEPNPINEAAEPEVQSSATETHEPNPEEQNQVNDDREPEPLDHIQPADQIVQLNESEVLGSEPVQTQPALKEESPTQSEINHELFAPSATTESSREVQEEEPQIPSEETVAESHEGQSQEQSQPTAIQTPTQSPQECPTSLTSPKIQAAEEEPPTDLPEQQPQTQQEERTSASEVPSIDMEQSLQDLPEQSGKAEQTLEAEMHFSVSEREAHTEDGEGTEQEVEVPADQEAAEQNLEQSVADAQEAVDILKTTEGVNVEGMETNEDEQPLTTSVPETADEKTMGVSATAVVNPTDSISDTQSNELRPSEAVANSEAIGGLPEIVELCLPETAEQPTDEFESVEQRREHLLEKYMESMIDARLFACGHCAATNMDGNILAQHLVVDCGTSMATLSPSSDLVKAREEADRQLRLQQEQQAQQHQEQGTTLVYTQPDGTVAGIQIAAGSGQQVATTTADGDVVMINVESDELAALGLMESDVQNLGGAQLVAQMGDGGAMTTEDGEVVQQFIIPDDLQLEEGQTLVVIQGEDGQPQLAIVNQADLIDANNTQMIIQSEDDQANNLLLYTNGQTQPTDVGIHREEEKENHQFTM